MAGRKRPFRRRPPTLPDGAGQTVYRQAGRRFVRSKFEWKTWFLLIKGLAMTRIDEIGRLMSASEPPELGPGPRAGVQPESSLNGSLDELFARGKLSAQTQQLIRALILLWHDHF